MPVPVPFVPRAPACLSRKHANPGNTLRTPSLSHHHGRALSLPSVGQPLTHTTLHPWTRHNDRAYDRRPATAVEEGEQGFRFGLASAANAPAIKGAHAKACFPPTFTQNCGLDVESGGACPWTAHDFLNQDVAAHVPSIGSCDDTQIKCVRGWSSTPNLCLADEPAVFGPLFEDDSSDLVNGELSSSPMEPLTPFGEYVDRAVATSDATAIYDPFVATSLQELRILYPDICGSKYSHLQPYSVKEGVHSGATQAPPTATLTYKRFAEPMAEWAVTYVWKVCTNGIPLPQSIGHYTPPNAAPLRLPVPLHLTNAVHSVLMSTLLQPSAVLLALWYIARLPVFFGAAGLGPEHVKERRFRAELLGDSRGNADGESAEGTATFRLILLGFMLANKWLDDHTFSNKTWHTISNVPVQSLNRLEYFALDILSHDLSVSPPAWFEWLKHLLSYHHSLSSSLFPQPISRPSSCPRSILRSTIQDIMEAPLGSPSDEPVFLGVDQRLREKFGLSNSFGDADSFDINLDEGGPLREEYLPRRRAGNSNASRRFTPGGGSMLPHNPSSTRMPLLPRPKWSPTEDEPVSHRNNRVSDIYVPERPLHPARYVAPTPVMYQAWTAAPITYLPLDGNYIGSSHNPRWCPPQIHTSQQVQSAHCVDLFRSSKHDVGYGTFDRSCGEGCMTPYGTGYPPFMTTSWVHLERYSYVPSRQPLGPHPSVNHQSNWLRA